MTSFLKISFFTLVVLSMAVIFQPGYNPHTPEEHGICPNHTAGQLIWIEDGREERRRTTVENHYSSKMVFSHGPDHVLRRSWKY